MTSTHPQSSRPGVGEDGRLLQDALALAVAVRGGDPIEVAELLASVDRPTSMILTLAALVDVDQPMHRWWQEEVVNDPTPCKRCAEPLGVRRRASRSPYHEVCRIAHRRQVWRDKEARRRLAQDRETATTARARAG